MKKLTTLALIALITFQASAQLKIDQSGYVGIANNSPQEALHVAGNGLFTSSPTSFNSAPFIRANNTYSAESNPDYSWYGDLATGFFHPADGIINMSINGEQKIRTSNFSRVYDDLPYGVGINSTSNYNSSFWVETEQASNQYHYTVSLNGIGKFYVTSGGHVQGVSSYWTSDRTLKSDIEQIDNPLKKLEKLNGYTYYYTGVENSPKKDKREVGVIAQEVLEVLPEAVGERKDGKLSVNYNGLIGLLIEGFKEQQQNITELESQINQLKMNNPSQNRIKRESELDILNSAILYQNNPNPFSENSVVRFNIPQEVSLAHILLFTVQGELLESHNISERGESQLTIKADSFKPGMYLYSLVLDNKEFDTKRLIITK